MRFNGPDYIPEKDDKRLSAQHDRIKNLMSDKQWRTLFEIHEITGDPEASISAQLRHLRKESFGSWILEKRSRGNRKAGLFEYRLMPSGHQSDYVVAERKNKLRVALEAVWRTHPECRKTIQEALKK